jgi:hypothetical protein
VLESLTSPFTRFEVNTFSSRPRTQRKMVSFTSLLAVAAVATVGVTYAAEEVDMASLPVGTYYRPTGTKVVSGFVGATTPYRRSPCPGLNTLANHGYLPRDGKNITLDTALAVVQEHYNLGDDLLALIASLTPSSFDLNDLSGHDDPIEHDASLTRVDSYFGGDESLIALNRTAELLIRGVDGTISLEDVAKARAKVVTWSETYNPEFSWGATQQFLANAESGLLLRVIGGGNTESAKTSFVTSFIVNEKLPTGWSKPPTTITYENITTTIANLAAVAV